MVHLDTVTMTENKHRMEVHLIPIESNGIISIFNFQLEAFCQHCEIIYHDMTKGEYTLNYDKDKQLIKTDVFKRFKDLFISSAIIAHNAITQQCICSIDFCHSCDTCESNGYCLYHNYKIE